MVFEGEADGREVAEGLVRSAEIVLHQPLGQIAIEGHGISSHISEVYEFILEGTVEPFVDGIVFGGFDSRPVMLKLELLAGGLKVPVELRAIIGLYIFDFRSSKYATFQSLVDEYPYALIKLKGRRALRWSSSGDTIDRTESTLIPSQDENWAVSMDMVMKDRSASSNPDYVHIFDQIIDSLTF